MAQLTIGSLTFTINHLKTLKYQVMPETDPTGTDAESYRVDLEIMGIVQAMTFASNTPKGGPPGDPLPGTMLNVRDALMRPRQPVLFQVAGQTVLQSPVPSPLAGGVPVVGTDAKVGPIIDDARYTQFSGDKTAVLYVRLHTWVNYTGCYCLGLRWDIEASIDEMQLTTRTIRGRASFRKDALTTTLVGGEPMMPDDFRNVIVPPCPDTMRRTGMRVTQDAAGTEIRYSCQDREMNLGTGKNSQVLKIECLPSAGVKTNIKDPKAALKKIWDTVKAAGSFDFAAVNAELWSAIPTTQAAGIARVWGSRNADFPSLIRVAVSVLLDRYAPAIAGLAACVSAWITINSNTEDNPFVEARMEFVGLNSAFFGAIISGDPSGLLNLNRDINFPAVDGKVKSLASQSLTPTQLPSANNTRGSWLGRLVAQQLLASAATSQPPPPPPANQPARDSTTGLV